MSGAIIFLLAAVFLFAALSKLRAQAAFREVLQNLIPAAHVRPAARVIPLLELLLTAFLLSGIAARAAAMVSASVLVIFTIFLVVMWRRGLKGCGCFGEDNENITSGSGIVRNGILIVLAVMAAAGLQPVPLYGPDLSTLLARLTVVTGAFCFWPCAVALVNRRKLIFNFSKVWTRFG